MRVKMNEKNVNKFYLS